MRFRLLACALFVATAFASGGGCSNETIILATLPATDAGTPAPVPPRCVTNEDCTDAGFDNYYCALSACGATSGTCTFVPLVCPDTEEPVCGCDGITYFNDCLRQQNGVGFYSSQSPCMVPNCGGPAATKCPSGALCAQLVELPHGPCDDTIPGTCWVIPAKCPDAPPPDRWDSCDSAGATCLDTCDAIAQGGSYRRSQQFCP